ncbi:magnesium transporter [Clostridium paridis]|uniref:Magnesium transporter n=1 Tax=Clostridium paridis TaxID=2803863 RepID=A0A937K5N5_9CLOT|nr:CBS domain-containing protein [Clostridium paridis]MBL4932565.1 magnesium transporter [Clostridium paridis]
MKKLNVFLYSSILNKKVYDEFDDVLGILKDAYVTTEEGYPRIIGYRVKKGNVMYEFEFRNIDFYLSDNNKIVIKTRGSKEILPRSYSYLLSQNLLDKNIVDINGKQVVRVNDLRIVEIAGEYRVVAVETGTLAIYRRKGIEKMVQPLMKLLHKDIDEQAIMWDDVESLELVNDSLQITDPYQKLSKLHPADLADILEDLDSQYRRKIFETLDEDLMADTLEEMEPEYKGTVIKELSELKQAEVLENLPNDEIADILDELDDESREKILISLEKGDAEEVKELLSYEDETAGSIMNKDFIALNIDITVREAIEIFRETKPDDEVMYSIYITDGEGRLLGSVALKDLIMNEDNVKLSEIMNDKVEKVTHNDSLDELVEKESKYDLLSIPVVDEENKLLGIVLMHDLVDEILLPFWRKKNRKAV